MIKNLFALSMGLLLMTACEKDNNGSGGNGSSGEITGNYTGSAEIDIPGVDDIDNFDFVISRDGGKTYFSATIQPVGEIKAELKDITSFVNVSDDEGTTFTGYGFNMVPLSLDIDLGGGVTGTMNLSGYSEACQIEGKTFAGMQGRVTEGTISFVGASLDIEGNLSVMGSDTPVYISIYGIKK